MLPIFNSDENNEQLGCVPFRLTYSGGALGMALITLACRFNSNAVMDVMGFRVNARSAPLTIMAFVSMGWSISFQPNTESPYFLEHDH